MEGRAGDAPMRGVVFDVGGTLTLSPHGTPFVGTDAEAASARLAALGHAHDREAFATHVAQRMLHDPKEGPDGRQINDARTILREAAARFGVALDDEEVRDLEAAFVEPYVRAAVPLPGILDVVRGLRGRVRLAVLSNTRSHRLIEGIVSRFGVRDAFDPFLTSDALGRRKPHPRGFETVLEAWRLPPHAVVMVGDAPDNDVAGARAVGMRAIWLRTASEHEDGGPADAVADTPADLARILDAWM